jgi:TrmH family RNA methyltransferase
MKLLSSRENSTIKSLHKWGTHAGRRGQPVLLDGIHLCQAWLTHSGLPSLAVFDVARLDEPPIQGLIRQLPPALCVALTSHLIQGLASVEQGQGVIFVVSPPTLALPDKITENCVLFDRIQDPGNVGTLLRTCAAAGIKRVFLSNGTAAAWSPKVLRSGQGAHFALFIHEHVDLSALIATLRVPLVATVLKDGQSLYSLSLPMPCAWIFGHEGQGVEAKLLARAALKVGIPHDAIAVESLNVHTAAAVCLFEQRRQALFRTSSLQ